MPLHHPPGHAQADFGGRLDPERPLGHVDRPRKAAAEPGIEDA